MAPVLKAVRPFADGDLEALLRFAAAYYGPDSHQARRTRFEWLYRENPLSQGPSKDLIVAVTESGEIAGCHWKTRLPWRFLGERAVIPSLHDLAILPEYRQGQGLPLVLAALAGEQRAALLGLSPTSEAIYQRMRCPEVPMQRFEKVLSYVRTSLGMMGLARPRRSETLILRNEAISLQASANPGDTMLRDALAIPSAGPCGLDWSMDSFRWRFFHPLGPQHVLVLQGPESAPTARAIFSYGLRRGAVMARLVDVAVAEPGGLSEILSAVECTLRRLGVAVATAATTSRAAHAWFFAHGWKTQQGVSARFFLRSKEGMPEAEIWGGSYDYGYDAN